MIKIIAEGLGNLIDQVVFIGGSVTELYSTNPEHSEDIRMTEDVDIVVQIKSISDFNNLEVSLRAKGFKNDLSPEAPICRWIYNGVKLDLMPDDSKILGFTNNWYTSGIINKVKFNIDDTTSIYIFDVIHYLASKFEAIKSRGLIDLRLSHDFEDVIFIFLNCQTLESSFIGSSIELKLFISTFLESISTRSDFKESISCALPYGLDTEVNPTILKMETLIDLKP